MKEFYAKKKYYVHEFQAIEDWFGNRGIPVSRGDFKEWCYDGYFLYWVCNHGAPSEITPEEDGDVMVCVLQSMYYECDHELRYYESPFDNKLKE